MDLFSWLRRENGAPGERSAPRGDDDERPRGPGASGPRANVPPDVPTPVSTERIVQWCERHGYAYFVDRDGDVGGIWRGRVFFFFLLGDDDEVLQVRGYWNREFAIERLPEVLEICNAWHVDKIWPSAYARVRDNGRVHVTAEVTTDVSCGATDDQLELMLQCGLGTGSVFFDHLDARYPDPATQAP